MKIENDDSGESNLSSSLIYKCWAIQKKLEIPTVPNSFFKYGLALNIT